MDLFHRLFSFRALTHTASAGVSAPLMSGSLHGCEGPDRNPYFSPVLSAPLVMRNGHRRVLAGRISQRVDASDGNGVGAPFP